MRLFTGRGLRRPRERYRRPLLGEARLRALRLGADGVRLLPPHQAGAGRAADEGRREDPVEQRRPTNTSSRAEVFLSGALHGDERVGPLAALALD